MPVVPRYTEQIAQQPTPNVRVSAEAPAAAFGAGAGRPLEAAGELFGGLSKIAAHEFDKANALRVTDADSEATARRNDLLWNPQSGAMARRGKNAIGATQEYVKQFDEHISEVESGLANDVQRGMFRQRAAKQRAELTSSLDRHEFQEGQVYAKSIFKSKIDSSRMDAENNFAMPGKVEESLREQEIAITAAGEFEGLPKEAVDGEISRAKSHTHRAVITRMASGQNDQLAKAHYDEYKDQITDSEDRIAVDKLVLSSSLLGQGQRGADRIIATVGNDEAKAFAASKAEYSGQPELRREVETQLDVHLRRIESAKRASEKKNDDTAWASASKGKMPPANIFDPLSPGMKKSVMDEIRRVASNEPIIPDDELFYTLRLAAAIPETRAKFANEYLLPYKSRLSRKQWDELFDVQQSLLKGDNTSADGIQSNLQIVNGTLAANGIDVTPKPGSDDAKRTKQIRGLIDEQVIAYETANKKKIPNEELQKIVDDTLAKRITAQGVFWDTTQDAGEITDVSDVPKVEQTKIKDSLSRSGRPVTPEAIIRAYQKKILRLPRVGVEQPPPYVPPNNGGLAGTVTGRPVTGQPSVQ